MPNNLVGERYALPTFVLSENISNNPLILAKDQNPQEPIVIYRENDCDMFPVPIELAKILINTSCKEGSLSSHSLRTLSNGKKVTISYNPNTKEITMAYIKQRQGNPQFKNQKDLQIKPLSISLNPEEYRSLSDKLREVYIIRDYEMSRNSNDPTLVDIQNIKGETITIPFKLITELKSRLERYSSRTHHLLRNLYPTRNLIEQQIGNRKYCAEIVEDKNEMKPAQVRLNMGKIPLDTNGRPPH